jgi:hypothetical protein
MTPTNPNLPVPPGFIADEWQDDVPLPYRILFGELRAIDGLDVDCVSVQATAIQYSDGRIDHGSVHEQPNPTTGGGPSLWLSKEGKSTV